MSQIQQLERRLVQLKNDALRRLGVSDGMLDEIEWAETPEDEPGDRGFPCFALAGELKRSPQDIAGDVSTMLGQLSSDLDVIGRVFEVGPYVNVDFDDGAFSELVISDILEDTDEPVIDEPEHWVIEYSAPNTNKPQHLGHVRNNLLGDSVCRILKEAGHDVTAVNLINDRGIHICKSMLAYRKWGDGETPVSSDKKGDKLVGDYYVLFDKKFKAEYADWLDSEDAERRYRDWREKHGGIDEDEAWERFEESYRNEYFNNESELGAEAKQMLRRWEQGDEDIVELWETMNGWVLDGFDETYGRLGVEFDDVYFESETYGRGKEIVEAGLDEGVFERLDDGAVAFDLEKIGMEGRKIVLRSDGTSVYMTQDLGTAFIRLEDFEPDHLAYVVGDEQDYHFRVLFGILRALDSQLEDRLHHLSYGMVFLPEGKLKSREGHVVEADELMDEMEALARSAVNDRYDDLSEEEVDRRAEYIGKAALKFHMLDYNPRTTVHFDPEDSIDFQGRTGPYCQYTYARIQSIERRHGGWPEIDESGRREALQALSTDREMKLINKLARWPNILQNSARNMDPGTLTGYLFELCQLFSSLYNDEDHRIVDIDDTARRDGLLLLCRATSQRLAGGLELLGIDTLDEM